MASQDKLREMFNEMDLEQKGNFIDNLKKSLEGSDDIESIQFLDECIGHYTMEMDFVASMEAEAAAATEPEPDPEPTAGPDPELETEPEPEPEPATEPEPEPEPAAELAVEPELDPELTVDPEVEPTADPELAAEPELAVEPEPELTAASEPELTPDPELTAASEPQAISADDAGILESVPESIEAPVTTKNKVDFIEMEISDLADNIRHKMSVIETISHLLSGTGSEIIEAVAQAKGSEPELPLDSTSAYEEKVNSIEVSISEFADNIRHDIKVMEAISDLLSGSGS